MCSLFHLATISSVLVLCASYRLLLMFPFPTRSHMILGEAYVHYLLEQGHDITYITPSIINDVNSSRLRQIEIQFGTKKKFLDVANLIKDKHEISIQERLMMMHNIAANTLQHKSILQLLNDTSEEFDAVIVEWILTEMYSGLSVVFNCPLIWSVSVDARSLVLGRLGNPYSSFAISDLSTPFTFWERCQELYMQLNTHFFDRWFLLPKEIETYTRVYDPVATKRGYVLPPFEVIRLNGSLILGNSYPSVRNVISLPDNYKTIGGYHIIKNKMKPLSEDLIKVMDESVHGVIYFSLGSVVQTAGLPEQITANLLQTFGLMNQTVIWKLEKVPSNVPNNVYIVTWAPQQSILAHPKTILFITHGGLLSINEAVYFGVPLVGIPAIADQFINVARIVKQGIGKRVRLTSNLHIDLKTAIQEVLANSSYQENVKELSEMYNDRPEAAGAELCHWVDHVVRTGGALHLRSPALMVPWYQKLYLELLASLFIVLSTVLFV